MKEDRARAYPRNPFNLEPYNIEEYHEHWQQELQKKIDNLTQVVTNMEISHKLEVQDLTEAIRILEKKAVAREKEFSKLLSHIVKLVSQGTMEPTSSPSESHSKTDKAEPMSMEECRQILKNNLL